MTVNNFVFLARDGYYDGVTFHRVIPGFMAQTGDPTGTGRGRAGLQVQGRVPPRQAPRRPRGALNGQRGKNTNGSQFFITFTATPHLDSAHSVFGKVVKGMDVVHGISARDPGTAATPGDAIETITIHEIFA